MKVEKHRDGLWHARRDAEDVTVCGLRRERQKAGRPAVTPSCVSCLASFVGAAVAPKRREPRVPATPAQRPDGRCVVCVKVRRRPQTGHRSAIAAWECDPFCSAECAKEFFGTREARFDDGEPYQAGTASRELAADDRFLDAAEAAA